MRLRDSLRADYTPEGGPASEAEHRAYAVLTGLVAAAWPTAEALQDGGDCEDAEVVVWRFGTVELAEDLADVDFDSPWCDDESRGDRGVGTTFGHECEHVGGASVGVEPLRAVSVVAGQTTSRPRQAAPQGRPSKPSPLWARWRRRSSERHRLASRAGGVGSAIGHSTLGSAGPGFRTARRRRRPSREAGARGCRPSGQDVGTRAIVSPDRLVGSMSASSKAPIDLLR